MPNKIDGLKVLNCSWCGGKMQDYSRVLCRGNETHVVYTYLQCKQCPHISNNTAKDYSFRQVIKDWNKEARRLRDRRRLRRKRRRNPSQLRYGACGEVHE